MQEINKQTLLAIDEDGNFYKILTSDGVVGAITELTPEEYAEIQLFWEKRKSVMEFVSVALEDPSSRIQYDENLRPYYVVYDERVYVDGTSVKKL